MNWLLREIGGNRFWLYASLPLAIAVLMIGRDAISTHAAYDDVRLRASAERLATIIARKFHANRLYEATEAQAREALARAFADGRALGARSRPRVVIQGSTPTHTIEGPAPVGSVSVTSAVSAAVVELADSRAYFKAEVTTTVALPKFNFTQTFTEPVNASTALVTPPPEDHTGMIPAPSPTKTARPSMAVALDAGLVAGPASAGWEIGARVYPRRFALWRFHGGLYGHYSSDGRLGAGVSVLVGR